MHAEFAVRLWKSRGSSAYIFSAWSAWWSAWAFPDWEWLWSCPTSWPFCSEFEPVSCAEWVLFPAPESKSVVWELFRVPSCSEMVSCLDSLPAITVGPICKQLRFVLVTLLSISSPYRDWVSRQSLLRIAFFLFCSQPKHFATLISAMSCIILFLKYSRTPLTIHSTYV